jgi:hypothetical protein
MDIRSFFRTNVSNGSGATDGGGDVSARSDEFWNPATGELFVHSHFYEPAGEEKPMWGDPPSNQAIEIVAMLANLDRAKVLGKEVQAEKAVIEGLKAITHVGDIRSEESMRIIVEANSVHGYRFDTGEEPEEFAIPRIPDDA